MSNEADPHPALEEVRWDPLASTGPRTLDPELMEPLGAMDPASGTFRLSAFLMGSSLALFGLALFGPMVGGARPWDLVHDPSRLLLAVSTGSLTLAASLWRMRREAAAGRIELGSSGSPAHVIAELLSTTSGRGSAVSDPGAPFSVATAEGTLAQRPEDVLERQLFGRQGGPWVLVLLRVSRRTPDTSGSRDLMKDVCQDLQARGLLEGHDLRPLSASTAATALAPSHVGVVAPMLVSYARAFLTESADGAAFDVTAGVAVARLDGADLQTLLDRALSASWKGDGLVGYHAPGSVEEARRREALGGNVRKALIDHEVFAYYQPIVEPLDGRVVGMEALARWLTASGELLGAASFVGPLDDSGVITDVGDEVIRAAARLVKRWRASGAERSFVSVNLGIGQLRDPRTVDVVREALERLGMKPDALRLEVPLSALMSHDPQADAVMIELASTGVSLWADDDGVEEIDFERLGLNGLVGLKLDAAMLVGDGQGPLDRHAVEDLLAQIRLARLDVIVKNVGTSAQRRAIEAMQGVRFVQGFAYCEPLPPHAATAAITSRTDPLGHASV